MLDGDGCSAKCTAEPDYVCEPNPIIGMVNSMCYYVGDINLVVVYIEKIDDANQVEILLDLFPDNGTFWDDVDFAAMVSVLSPVAIDSYTVKRNPDGTVSILISYLEDIHNVDLTVQIDPTKSGKLALSRQLLSQRVFPVVPTDNEVAYFYDDNTYNQAKLVNILATVIAASALFFYMLGIFTRKLVGVELIAVIQISFLSLLCLPTLNPIF